MAKKQSRKAIRLVPKTVLRLPDLDQAKSAVLNSLSSIDAQRGYRHAIEEFMNGTARSRVCPSVRALSSGIAYTSNLGILRPEPSISASVQCAASLTRLPTAVC
jgi:hypothetical protein